MTLWLAVTAAPLILVVLLGLAKLRLFRCSGTLERGPFPAAEVLIPSKGLPRIRKNILESLLTQRYPNYWVTFVVESRNDPVNSVLEQLCARIRMPVWWSVNLPPAAPKRIRISWQA